MTTVAAPRDSASEAAAGRLRPGQCEVWWADAFSARSDHLSLLDADERARRASYVRAEDRDRFTIGCVVLRLVLGSLIGLAPDRIVLDRRCDTCGRPHGRPRLRGSALRLSVSHSGARVAVAIAHGSAVGVDIERINSGVGDVSLMSTVLASTELDSIARIPSNEHAEAFAALWTRKEAALKMTGDVLSVEPTGVVVSAPPAPPQLLAYRGRPDLLDRVTLHELEPAHGYRAAVALHRAGAQPPRELDATPLLAARHL